MVRRITRKNIIQTKRIICSELSKLQQAFHDEEVLQSYKDDNEEALYWEQFDCIGEEVLDYPAFPKVIGLDHSEIESFVPLLSEKLRELFQGIGTTHFLVLAHLKSDFFGNRNNPFPPLKEAYRKLEQLASGKTYEEAFEVDLNALPDLLEILFWITRCDPSAPEYLFLFDREERFQMHVCKYGNIHLIEYNEERFTTIQLNSLGWTIIEGQETDNFSSN